MRLMVCKSTFLMALLLLSSNQLRAQSMDGGIPVFCDNCAIATQNGAIAIGEQIRGQTKILQEALNYQLNTSEYNAGVREAAIEDTRAAMHEERTLGKGSIPRDTCAVYSATGGRAQGSASSGAIREHLSKSSMTHTRQSRALPLGEPRTAYSVERVISELDDEDLLVGEALMSDKPLNPEDQEAYADLKRLQNIVAVPFPVPTPSEVEIERVKEHGTPVEREQLAASIALQRRQELAAFVLDAMTERNTQRIDPAGMEQLLENRIGAENVEALNLDEKLSPNQLDEILNTYRVQSPEWYIDVAESEDVIKLARDQSMMQAEMLNSIWELRKLVAQSLKLDAYDSIRDVSQTGLMSR
ncbi:MAG: hypothetical protein V7693_16235 [Halopseudomonas sabulinigri]